MNQGASLDRQSGQRQGKAHTPKWPPSTDNLSPSIAIMVRPAVMMVEKQASLFTWAKPRAAVRSYAPLASETKSHPAPLSEALINGAWKSEKTGISRFLLFSVIFEQPSLLEASSFVRGNHRPDPDADRRQIDHLVDL